MICISLAYPWFGMDADCRVAHPDQTQARTTVVRKPAGAGANGYGEKVSFGAIIG